MVLDVVFAGFGALKWPLLLSFVSFIYYVAVSEVKFLMFAMLPCLASTSFHSSFVTELGQVLSTSFLLSFVCAVLGSPLANRFLQCYACLRTCASPESVALLAVPYGSWSAYSVCKLICSFCNQCIWSSSPLSVFQQVVSRIPLHATILFFFWFWKLQNTIKLMNQSVEMLYGVVLGQFWGLDVFGVEKAWNSIKPFFICMY